MQFVLKAGDNNMVTFAQATERLASEQAAHTAFRRALNHTGDKANTQVKRALAKQTGLRQRDLVKYGGLSTERANFRSLAFKIQSDGRALPLKLFGAKQFSFGVRAKPWGKSRRFESAFIFAGHPKSGRPVAGGHVFVRTSARSYPIQQLWGPSVPEELLKGAPKKAFQDAAVALPERVAHEVSVLTKGVVGR